MERGTGQEGKTEVEGRPGRGPETARVMVTVMAPESVWFLAFVKRWAIRQMPRACKKQPTRISDPRWVGQAE